MVSGKRSTVKSYRVLSFLSVVSKAFEKFVNNRLVGHLAKYRLFSDFQYGFRSSRLTADLLIVAPDRLISEAFGRVRNSGLPHELRFYGISGQVFSLHIFSEISSFGWF